VEIDEPNEQILPDPSAVTVTRPKSPAQTTANAAPVIFWDINDGEPSNNNAPINNNASIAKPLSSIINKAPAEPVATTLTAYVNGKKQTIDAFKLVCAVTANEVSDSFEDEAIKAQAVAAYSYIKCYDDHGEAAEVTANFNYSSRIEKMVRDVWGIACYYNGKVARTVYSASSAGYTASASNVWGGSYPYLVSVATPFDAASDPNYGIKKSFSESAMRNKLQSSLGINLSDNPANWINIESHIDGNYVGNISIDGQKQISGRDFREEVMDYGIRSSSFSVDYSNGKFTITTYGYGHGVGMSQNGANILAKQGMTYDQILKFYYTGIEVK
jgi:stage II sporulation protein D